MSIDTKATARREHARVPNGTFGRQPHQESGVVAPIHGDEIRARVSEAVDDAMGGPWLLEPSVSPYVVSWTTHGVPQDITVNMAEIGRGPYATKDTTAAVARLLPNLPTDRAEWHAEQIAQAHLMSTLYSDSPLNKVKLLADLEMCDSSHLLLLTDREPFRDQDGYDWDAWSDAEAAAWASEHFRRTSAAVDEDRRVKAGIAA
jgi:hypothetical protein